MIHVHAAAERSTKNAAALIFKNFNDKEMKQC